MEDSVQTVTLVQQSLRLASSQSVLIAGPSGSGKSFLANQLAALFGHTIISLDNFFLDEERVPFEVMLDGSCCRQWESIAALDLDLIYSFLRDIIAGETVKLPKYSFSDNKRIGFSYISLGGGGLVLEGINSFFFEGVIREAGCSVLKIFVDIDLAKRDEIIRERDHHERGKIGSFEERLRILRTGEQRWIYPQRGAADLILFREA